MCEVSVNINPEGLDLPVRSGLFLGSRVGVVPGLETRSWGAPAGGVVLQDSREAVF